MTGADPDPNTDVTRGSLFKGLTVPAHGETTREIMQIANVTIEEILTSPDLEPIDYDQVQDEWVLVVEGRAAIALAGPDGEPTAVELEAGDWLLIPARTKHRVNRVGAGTRWLTVHVHPPA
jgi:cupin 2 domain-containing protein